MRAIVQAGANRLVAVTRAMPKRLEAEGMARFRAAASGLRD